jgi:hypothetical protein
MQALHLTKVEREFFYLFGLFAVTVLAVLLIGVATGVLHADTRPGALTNPFDLPTVAIPTTATDISSMTTGIPAGRNIYVCHLDISMAPGNSSVNVSVYDNQATPGYFLNTLPFTPTATTGTAGVSLINASNDLGCRLFKGGMTILASGAGVQIAVSGKY